ncbi:MAG: SpoIIE family protein phosphatase [Actinomycetota bacterium]|nr:SpoIIE family protein phosphatase [Actinomycetota bacterium]
MTVTGTGPATGGGELAGVPQDTSPAPRRRAGHAQRPPERLVVVGAACWCVAAMGVGVGLAQPAVAAVLVAAPVAVSGVASAVLTAVFAVVAVSGAVGLGSVHHWSSTAAYGLVVGGVAAGSAVAVGVAAARSRVEAERTHAEQGQERERRRRRAVEASDRLHRLSAALASCGTVGDVTETTFASLRAEVGADAALLGVMGDRTDDPPSLRFLRSFGYRADIVQRWPREPLAADMPAAAVVRTGQPVFAGSADVLARRWPTVAGDILAGRLQAVCVLPLVVSSHPVGFVSVSWSGRRRFTEDERGFLQALAEQCAQALERARLAEDERRARRRMGFLGDVTKLVASSLEPSAVMARLADLVVAAMADACAVLVPDGPVLRCDALAGRTRHASAMLADVVACDSEPEGDGPASRAFNAGRRQVVQLPAGTSNRDPDGAEPGSGETGDAGLGPADVLALPLIAGGDRIGVMVFLSGLDAAAFGDDDVSLAAEIAARTSTALYNATRYQHERDLAALLQRAVLPEELPSVPGVVLDAVYQAGTAGTEVGGDWFDAVGLDDGRLLVSVGDVMGKGPAAAALMSQVRSAARAYGVADPRPSIVLRRLDRLLATFGDTRLVSAVVAVVEPSSGLVRLASAGHPPALVVGPDRQEVVVGGRQRMLGIDVPDIRSAGGPDRVGSAPKSSGRGGQSAASDMAEVESEETTVLLGWSDALVLYSDGLVERRGEPVTDGIARLAAAATDCLRLDRWRSGAATCLAEALATQDTADDVVVLTIGTPDAVLAFDVPGATGTGAGRSAAAGVLLPPEPASGPAARHWLAALLEREPGVSDSARDVAVLLVDELVANAVIHAGTDIALGARVDGGVVHVEVADRSPLLPIVKDLGTQSITGRGLLLVRSLASAWGTESSGGGKVVWFEVGDELPGPGPGAPGPGAPRSGAVGPGGSGAGVPGPAVPRSGAVGPGGSGAGASGPAAPRSGARPAGAHQHLDLSTWSGLSSDAPGAPGAAVAAGDHQVSVGLAAVPVGLAVQAASHFDAVRRELQVLEGSWSARGPGSEVGRVIPALAVPVHRIGPLGASVGGALAPAVAQWRTALAEGRRTLDLHVDVPASTGPLARELDTLLDDVERWCRAGVLLAVAVPPDVVAFRRWALGQVAVQCAGGRPSPWPGAR